MVIGRLSRDDSGGSSLLGVLGRVSEQFRSTAMVEELGVAMGVSLSTIRLKFETCPAVLSTPLI